MYIYMGVDEDINELKTFLYDTTFNIYTDDEIKYIIDKKLLEF